MMRTTLDIGDDVLAYARSEADRTRRSIGEVISDLARRALRQERPAPEPDAPYRMLPRRPLPHPITLEFVNALRDEPA